MSPSESVSLFTFVVIKREPFALWLSASVNDAFLGNAQHQGCHDFHGPHTF
jgi:hypothetical protein